jgi:hypothetical protein
VSTEVSRETEPPTTEEADLLNHGAYHSSGGVLMLDPADEVTLSAARRLEDRGLVRFCGTVSWCAGEHCYQLTELGMQLAAQLKASREPKLTRSQLRYRQWLHDASEVMTFAEFLTKGAS